MDAFGHVNNIVFFRYFESARVAYFEEADLFEHMKACGIGPILASTKCRFRRPIVFPDTVTVGARIKETLPDRWTMTYQIYSRKLQDVAAEGEAVVVMCDYQTGKKTPIPKIIQEKVTAIEKRVAH